MFGVWPWSFPQIEQKFTEFREFVKLLKHELQSIQDPFCYICVTGAEVTSWSLVQEVAGSNNPFNYKYVLLNSVKTFGKTYMYLECAILGI